MSKTSNKTKKRSKNSDWVNLISFGLIILVIVGGGIWLIYQTVNPTSPSAKFNLYPIKDNWSALETKARQWKDDAYLFGAVYDISAVTKLTLKYQALSDLTQELVISIPQSGELSAKPLDLGFEAAVSKPIRSQDFSVDSQKAMETMLKDKTAGACMNSEKTSKQLSMESDMTGYPVWTLSIVNCPDTNRVKTVYLNAQSGNIFIPSDK